ncbi:HepT-like ribonuclease domain-containing protein [Clostridium pascui]|uniref:HepT-like ribonuclease domain-containing protein n=1 Tax=Clostridium pascui TaxID=46609 RepID=UPI0024357421|nr:HepT-like ribonuclease domain-containing protein [Clostridium pascui]
MVNILGDKIINETLKNNLCNMAGFRNILVHDYMKLDRGLVYDIINNNLLSYYQIKLFYSFHLLL